MSTQSSHCLIVIWTELSGTEEEEEEEEEAESAGPSPYIWKRVFYGGPGNAHTGQTTQRRLRNMADEVEQVGASALHFTIIP